MVDTTIDSGGGGGVQAEDMDFTPRVACGTQEEFMHDAPAEG